MNRKKCSRSNLTDQPHSEGVIGASPKLALAEGFVADERRLSWQLACTRDYIDLP
jgi:hypothetical protein